MKNIAHIIFIFLFGSSILMSQGGLINNPNARIQNKGTGKIIIKTNRLDNKAGATIENDANAIIEIEKPASFDSEGSITNEGLIEAFGPITQINQPTINGTVIIDSDDQELRYLPQISYNNLHLRGLGRKFLSEENKILETRNFLLTTDGTPIIWDANLQGIEIHSRNYVQHFGTINPTGLHGRFKLNGMSLQDVGGTGRFTELELDNSEGARVVDTTGTNSQGFRVANTLYLTSGELQNSTDANFTMNDSTTIIRNFGSSLSEEPIFAGRVDVQYIGDGQMTSGGELPSNETSLQELLVENVDGIILNKDVTANERIYAGSNIRAYQTDVNDNITDDFTLTFTNNTDPEFNGDTEIEGKFRRTNLRVDGTENLFNNRVTSAVFNNNTNPDDISTLTFDVKPGRRWSLNPRNGDQKIQRTFAFTATNSNGDDLANATALNINYAWKHDTDNKGDINLHETPDELENRLGELILQWWNDQTIAWENNNSSSVPAPDGAWLTANANLNKFGDHAVGLSASDYLYILAKVMMEGPYSGGEMRTNLADANLVPLTPPDIYPYNLDPNRTLHTVQNLPADVVDWVTIEFRDRPLNPNERYFRTCFLRKDGQLVDGDGQSPVRLSRVSTNNIDTTGAFYWIAIRHRSHLTIMSRDSLYLGPDENPLEYDFSNPILLYGGSARPIDVAETGNVRYGMIAGNLVDPATSIQDLLLGGGGVTDITGQDYEAAWNSFNLINIYLSQDFNMDGIITTRDYNMSWNNRDQITPVK